MESGRELTRIRQRTKKTLKPTTGKTLTERVRNSDVRAAYKVEDVAKWARKRRYWRYHEDGMDQERLAYINTNGKLACRRPLGRP